MARFTRYDRGDVLTKYEQKPFECGGPVLTFSNLQLTQTVWDVRAIESRPYPLTPLYQNLTAQPEAITRVFRYRVTQYATKATGSCGGSTRTWPVYTYAWTIPTAPTRSYALTSSEVTQAMRLQVKDRFVNLADTIGEYREAVMMAAAPIKAVVDVVKDVIQARKATRGRKYVRIGKNRYRRKATLYRQLQLLPATVVMADFGLNPSIDLLDEVMVRWNARLTQPFIVRVGATRSARTVETLNGVKGSQVTEGIHWMKGVGYVRLNSIRDQQFESGNIAEAIWAGIPFSFLVDRFIRVGDWLSAFDALEGTTYVGGTLTTRERYVLRDSRVTAADTSSTTYTNLHEGRGTYRSHKRDLLPSLALGRPYYRPNRDVTVLRDLVSILIMSVAGRRVEGLLDLARNAKR